MRYKYLLVIAFVFVCNALQAQASVKSDTTIAQLKQIGVDTFIVYQNFCAGCEEVLADELTAECYIDDFETYHLYWKVSNTVFVVRVDNCYYYQPIVVQSGFVKEALLNLPKLKTEVMKPFAYHPLKKNGKRSKKSQSSYIDHGGFTRLTFITGTDTIFKPISWFDLDDTSPADSTAINLSKEYNSKTLQVQYANMVEEELKGLTFTKINKP